MDGEEQPDHKAPSLEAAGTRRPGRERVRVTMRSAEECRAYKCAIDDCRQMAYVTVGSGQARQSFCLTHHIAAAAERLGPYGGLN